MGKKVIWKKWILKEKSEKVVLIKVWKKENWKRNLINISEKIFEKGMWKRNWKNKFEKKELLKEKDSLDDHLNMLKKVRQKQ